MNTKTLRVNQHGLTWRVELDKDQVFPDNPGEGTPAMLYSPFGKSATYACATDTGECDGTEIPAGVLTRLVELEDEINAFLYGGDAQ